MREPTSLYQSLAWWRSALQGNDLPRHDSEPECGFFQMRKVKGGPWVPVSIRLVQELDPETGELTEPERLECLVSGIPADPARIWTYLRPITREAFEALSARSVGQDPTKKINLMRKPVGPND
jgi:hypothetical protein